MHCISELLHKYNNVNAPLKHQTFFKFLSPRHEAYKYSTVLHIDILDKRLTLIALFSIYHCSVVSLP